jgi:hypothetical protein
MAVGEDGGSQKACREQPPVVVGRTQRRPDTASSACLVFELLHEGTDACGNTCAAVLAQHRQHTRRQCHWQTRGVETQP